MKILLPVLILILSGCASTRAERMVQRHGNDCEQMGFAVDTDPWRQCVLTSEQQRLQRIGIGFGLMQSNRPQQPIRCTTLGTVTTCQ